MENHIPFLRQDALDTLSKRVRDFKEGYRQNVAILGEELSGKTTLLKNFINSLTDERLTCIYVDVVPFEFSLFAKRFLNSLLYNFLKNTQLLSTRESLENLVKRAKEQLPATTPMLEAFLSKIDKEKPGIHSAKKLICPYCQAKLQQNQDKCPNCGKIVPTRNSGKSLTPSPQINAQNLG